MNIRLYTHPRSMQVGGILIRLSPNESTLLRLIIDAGDTPISHASLLFQLYGNASPKSNSVAVTICRLRRKLQPYGYQINARRTRGYTISFVRAPRLGK